MFEWKVEEMVLMNSKSWIIIGREKIFNCENNVSREDKIAFVDSMQDGRLSYLLELIEQFAKDKDTLPKDKFGNIKTVSLQAWIRKHDTGYARTVIDAVYSYGQYNLLGTKRNILNNTKGPYDTYDDLVDELFHRQLKECERQENRYFLEHDEYSILKKKFLNYWDKYGTTFGVSLAYNSSGNVFILNKDDSSIKREIKMEELQELISKYELIEAYIEKLTAETKILY